MANVDFSRASMAPPDLTVRFGGEAIPEDEPVLLPAAHASLVDGKDDMAATLASIMRRQAGRRIEKPAKTRTAERPNSMSDAHRSGLARMRILIQGSGTGFGPAYEHARSIFPDPEELALALAGLRESPDIDTDVQSEIDAALAALLREHGNARLSPGLNTRTVVGTFAERMNIQGHDLRRAYRTLAGATACEGVTYRYLIDTFGFARRGLALDFLEQALAADLSSDTPSHPPEEFQPLQALLFQLRLLRSADALLLSASRHHKRRKQPGKPSPAVELFDEAVINLLISCLSDIQDACRQFTHCLQQWRKFSGSDNVLEWTNRILRSMAEVPVELFPDLAYRQALLTSLCDVVDNLFRSQRCVQTNLRSLHV